MAYWFGDEIAMWTGNMTQGYRFIALLICWEDWFRRLELWMRIFCAGWLSGRRV